MGTLHAMSDLLSLRVSIQLVSPASGDSTNGQNNGQTSCVSIQLVSPASGDDICASFGCVCLFYVSIQLVSPASGDTTISWALLY